MERTPLNPFLGVNGEDSSGSRMALTPLCVITLNEDGDDSSGLSVRMGMTPLVHSYTGATWTSVICICQTCGIAEEARSQCSSRSCLPSSVLSCCPAV